MLIVARMDVSQADAVAGIFAESDASGLPEMMGATRRTLFHFQGLYLHLVEAPRDITGDLYQARSHPFYRDINTKLGDHVSAYDPATWREPKDAMATPFYTWQAGSVSVPNGPVPNGRVQ